jgi:hypothetical protein
MPATLEQMNLVKNIWHQLTNNPTEKLLLATNFLCACSNDQVEDLLAAGVDLRATAFPAAEAATPVATTTATPASATKAGTPAPTAKAGTSAAKAGTPGAKTGTPAAKTGTPAAPKVATPAAVPKAEDDNDAGDEAKIQWDDAGYKEHNNELCRQAVTFGPWDSDNDGNFKHGQIKAIFEEIHRNYTSFGARTISYVALQKRVEVLMNRRKKAVAQGIEFDINYIRSQPITCSWC